MRKLVEYLKLILDAVAAACVTVFFVLVFIGLAHRLGVL